MKKTVKTPQTKQEKIAATHSPQLKERTALSENCFTQKEGKKTPDNLTAIEQAAHPCRHVLPILRMILYLTCNTSYETYPATVSLLATDPVCPHCPLDLPILKTIPCYSCSKSFSPYPAPLHPVYPVFLTPPW